MSALHVVPEKPHAHLTQGSAHLPFAPKAQPSRLDKDILLPAPAMVGTNLMESKTWLLPGT